MTQLSITFDSQRAEKLAEEGIAKAEARRSEEVAFARDIAEGLLLAHGEITADDVQQTLEGLGKPRLGNAAGSVFKDKRFVWTGKTAKSSAVARHGGLIRIWRLA